MPLSDALTRFTEESGVPRDNDGPVFAEPWQAEAFALAVRLHEAGCFTWSEWATTLGDVLREVRERGETDDGSRYYEHWLAALERLIVAKQVLSDVDLNQRKKAWVEAYLSTPHGKPVALGG
ncbi:MAG: nitrile hydratase accessory protein [Acetobacteraceae bacterium]